MNKTVYVLLLAGCLIVTGTLVYADGPRAFGGRGDSSCNGKGDRPFAALNLTTEQQQEIGRILDESRAARQPQREMQQQKQQQMRALLTSETVDATTLRQLAHEQADLRVDMRLARHDVRNRIEAVLTPEQKQQWQQMREERQERREQRHEDRQERGHHGGQRHGYGPDF